MKGVGTFFVGLVVTLILFSQVSLVFAQEDEEDFSNVEDINGGIGPDNVLYFLDKFFDRFADELDVREEKVGEIRDMIENGDFKAARKALKEYKEYIKTLRDEADPEKEKAAKESYKRIRKALKEIEKSLDRENREEFYEDIIGEEEDYIEAVEISGKIKELCEVLYKLDPNEYSKVCKTDDGSQKWHKELDRELTDEQRKIARDFKGIMMQCFETSGQDCRCEDIPFADFSEACLVAAPLATACDIDGDEEACEELNQLKMPPLPHYLEDLFKEMEEGVGDAKFDMHMPRDCVEAGATTRIECEKVMIRKHAPEECREALLEADIQSEEEGRKLCSRIMMEKHAPECIEEGITNEEECRDYMFNIDRRPKECVENRIHDIRDCKRFLEEEYEERRPEYGKDCGSIENPEERLACYDGVIDYAKDYQESFMEIRERERECANTCEREGGRWDFTGGECKCYKDDYSDYEKPINDYPSFSQEDFDERCAVVDCEQGYHCEGNEEEVKCVEDENYNEVKCEDCAKECGEKEGHRLRATSCGDNGCECEWESSEPDYAPGEGPDEPEEEIPTDEPEEEEPAPSDEPEEGGEDNAPEGSGLITGNVISNSYLDYLYS